MDTIPICYSATGIDTKQKDIFALPLVIGAKRNKFDVDESEKPLKTQTRKCTLPIQPICYSKFAKSTHHNRV